MSSGTFSWRQRGFVALGCSVRNVSIAVVRHNFSFPGFLFDHLNVFEH